MAECNGQSDDHCCHLGRFGPCRFVGKDQARWVCRLRVETGSWAGVHADARYRTEVRPKLDAIGVVVDCGDWPPPGETCGTCGVSGG